MYPYAQRDNPPKAEIFDVGTKAWSGLPPRGMEYWERLDEVIQREPVEPHDIFFQAMLRPPGRSTSENPDRRRIGWRGYGKGQLGRSPLQGWQVSIRRALGFCVAARRR